MNWVDITWIAMSAASLTLGVIHLFVWFKRRARYAHLLFFALAASATAFGTFELALMHAPSPAAYATTLRSAHVPLAMFVLSLVWFVHFYFGAGRLWLAWAVCALRLLGLALNFVTGVNINFSAVTSLDPMVLWGGATVTGPVGIANPLTIVPRFGNLLLLIYVVDAAHSLWKRGDADSRRRAIVVGGSLALLVSAVAGFAALTILGVVHAPTIVMPGVFLIVLAMGSELGWDTIAAAQLAERLRASEMRFRAVFEAAPSAMLLVDATGRVTLANAQATAVFGWPREQIVGRAVEALLPQDMRAAHVAHRVAYAREPQSRPMGAGRELHALRQDGTEIAVEVALSPMQTAAGAFVLASMVDISERRRAEQAAAVQRSELAHLSRVATLGALSGSMAHELNQPLAAILSNAQAAQRFLARTPPDLAEVAAIIADIVKNDRRAAAVIERLRALLRKEPSEYVPLDLNEAVEEVLHLMHSDLLGRRVAIRADLDAALPRVAGDRVQLQQVLLNFLVNGCDAMEEVSASRVLVVRTRRIGGGSVELSVADRGSGIAPEILDRIFEPFVSTKPQGMGLGLAICRGIVEAHRGRIWASNNVEGGATLHLELSALP